MCLLYSLSKPYSHSLQDTGQLLSPFFDAMAWNLPIPPLCDRCGADLMELPRRRRHVLQKKPSACAQAAMSLIKLVDSLFFISIAVSVFEMQVSANYIQFWVTLETPIEFRRLKEPAPAAFRTALMEGFRKEVHSFNPEVHQGAEKKKHRGGIWNFLSGSFFFVLFSWKVGREMVRSWVGIYWYI